MPQVKVVTPLVITLTLLFVLLGNANAAKAEVYELARAPQSSATKLFMAWNPYLQELKAKTNIEIKLRLFPSRDEFEKYLLAGKSDFYFASPFYYLIARNKHKFIPLVRSDAKQLKGIIVAKKDSKVQAIEDLNGQVVSFPGQNALGASLYIRSFLAKQGIIVEPIYVKTHENSYLTALVGKSVASGGVGRTFKEFDRNDEMKKIFTTPGLAPHPLFANTNVPEEVRKAVTDFTLGLNSSEAGKKILKDIKLASPIQADHARDYEQLNQLNIIDFSTFKE